MCKRAIANRVCRRAGRPTKRQPSADLSTPPRYRSHFTLKRHQRQIDQYETKYKLPSIILLVTPTDIDRAYGTTHSSFRPSHHLMEQLPTRLQGALRIEPRSRERRSSDQASVPRSTLFTSILRRGSGNAMNEPSCKESTPSTPLQQHTCQAQACAVIRTFGTTELLEIILSFLETSDVLNLRRVCRKWNNVTHESPNLRLHYFIRPSWDRRPEEFELLGLKLSGLTIEPGDHMDKGRWIRIRMSANAASSICPEGPRRRRPRAMSIFEGLRGGLGSKPQQDGNTWAGLLKTTDQSLLKQDELYVIQPPIVGMQAFLTKPAASGASSSTTPADAEVESDACAKVHCEAGINLGFLAETALTLLSSNDATAVVFKAIVSFSEPEREPRKRRKERNVTYIS